MTFSALLLCMTATLASSGVYGETGRHIPSTAFVLSKSMLSTNQLVFIFFLLLGLLVSAEGDGDSDTATRSFYTVPNPTLIQTLKSYLDPSAGFAFGKPCSDRTDWEVRKQYYENHKLKTDGESFLGTPQPPWSDDDYLDYYTSKDRTKGEDMMNARLNRLLPLAVAECFYWDGRYAAQLNQELILIANQRTWVWPAHGILI